MVVSITFKPTIVFVTVFTVFCVYLTYNTLFRSSSIVMTGSDRSWSSVYEGWYSRTSPHPSPSEFTPTRESLAFAVLRNAQADPDGFTLALFNPDIAVDAMGRVQIVQKDDFTGLVNKAEQTLNLPPTGSFMNAWRIAQLRTEQPIDRVFVPGVGGELVQTSVQGFEKGKKELKKAVGDKIELPYALYELVGLVLEAREGYMRCNENKDAIEKVKGVLGDA